MLKSIVTTLIGFCFYFVNCTCQEVDNSHLFPCDRDWSNFKIGNLISLCIPPSLEMREDGSTIKTRIDQLYYALELKLTSPNIVFQPKGLDDNLSKLNDQYARVLVYVIDAGDDPFPRNNEILSIAKDELNEIETSYKTRFENFIRGSDAKLIDWSSFEVGQNDQIAFIKFSMRRIMGNNPIVRVQTYLVFNSSTAFEITVSYRETEALLWANDLDKIINTVSLLD